MNSEPFTYQISLGYRAIPLFQKTNQKQPDVVVYLCYPDTWELEAGGSQTKTLSQKNYMVYPLACFFESDVYACFACTCVYAMCVPGACRPRRQC